MADKFNLILGINNCIMGRNLCDVGTDFEIQILKLVFGWQFED